MRLPIKDRAEPIETDSRKLFGRLSADEPGAVDSTADGQPKGRCLSLRRFRRPG